MTWMSIRLELARTPEFPEGSASRAYLLHVPVDDDGLVDAHARELYPAMATVRRFWANEADRTGYLIPTNHGWAISYRLGDADDELVYHLGDHQLVVGNYLTITDPDSSELPFRVAEVAPITVSRPASQRQRQSEAPRESS